MASAMTPAQMDDVSLFILASLASENVCPFDAQRAEWLLVPQLFKKFLIQPAMGQTLTRVRCNEAAPNGSEVCDDLPHRVRRARNRLDGIRGFARITSTLQL
jgi:hypothetical protein